MTIDKYYICLRGGGCGTTKIEPQPISLTKQTGLQKSNLLDDLRKYSKIISEKSSTVFDKAQSDEVMIAIQWFNFNKENFDRLCQNDRQVAQAFDIALISLDQVLRQITVYLRASGFLCLQILQICNDLFRIVFSVLLKNQDRFIEDSYKQQILEYLSEFENNLKLESQNIWITGAEFELTIMQVCVENCRSNSQKGQEILINFMSGLVSSFMSMSPTEDLIYSLIEGAQYIFAAIQKKIENSIQLYEIYYFFESLKWLIIRQLRQSQFSVKSQLNQLMDGYTTYIANSKNWLIHFCWLKLITDLLTYRPIVNKFDFFKTQDSVQQQLNWNKLLHAKLLTLLSYNRNEAKINLFNDYQSDGILKQFESQLQLVGFNKIRQFQKYLLEEKAFQSQTICESYCQFTFNQNNNDRPIHTFLSNLNIDKCQNTLTIIQKITSDYNILCQDLLQNFNILIENQGQTKNSIQLQQDHCASLVSQLESNTKSLIFLIVETQSQLLTLANSCQLTISILDLTAIPDDQRKVMTSQVQIIKDSFGEPFYQLIREIQSVMIYQNELMSNYQIHFQNASYIHIKPTQQFNTTKFNSSINKFTEYSFKIINEIKLFNHQSNQLIPFKQHQQRDGQITDNQLFNLINKLISRDFLNHYVKQAILIFEKIQQNQNEISLDDQIKVNYNLIYLLNGIISQIRVYEYQIYKVELAFKSTFSKDQEEIKEVNLQQQHKEVLIRQGHYVDELFQDYKNASQLNKETLNFLIKQINADFDSLNNAMPLNEFKKDQMRFFMDIQSLLLQIQLQPVNLDQSEQKLRQLYQDQIKSVDNNPQQTNNQNEDSAATLQQQNLNQLKFLKSYLSQKLFDFQEFLQNLNEINLLLLNSQKIDDQNVQINEMQREVMQTFKAMHYIKFNKDLEEMKNLEETLFTTNEQKIKNDIIQGAIEAIYNFDDHIDQSFEVEIELDPFIWQSQQQIQQMSNTDKNNNQNGSQDYKIRECLAFNIIKIQQIIQEEPINKFSQNIISQLWIHEKDERVKRVLKNKEMIELQRRLFSKDITTISETLKQTIQSKFDIINMTEQEIQMEIDPKKKGQLQKKMLILNQELDEYVEGVNEMSSKMDLNFVFLKEIQKQLHLIKEKIQNIQNSINQLSVDLSRLRGKRYDELLEIRKQRVLLAREQEELNEIYIPLNTMIIDPITGQDIKASDLQQEINDFLLNQDKMCDVMLITGKAGSGKSKASERIEVELWKLHTNNEQWIPLFISLPTIKHPQFNIIDQGLEKEQYQFDKLQIKELKEAIKKKKLKVVVILDSYDEMRSEYIQSNLFNTNKFIAEFGQDVMGSNFKVVITSRRELLTVMGYQTWFCGSSLEKMKEIMLLSLNEDQCQDYIKQYCLFCIKRSIISIYEKLISLQGKQFIVKEFLQVWNSIHDFLVQETNFQNTHSNQLLGNNEIKHLIRLLKCKSLFKSLNDNQVQQLSQTLFNIWSIKKYLNVIHNSNLQILFNTPFMLNVVVQVLPNLTKSNKEISTIKDQFLQNFINIKKKLIESEQTMMRLKNDLGQQEFNDKDLKDVGMKIIMNLDNQNFFNFFSESNTLELIDDKSLRIMNQLFNVENDGRIVYESLKQKQFTSYQFYESFISYYHDQQIDKWKKMGKVYNYETVKVDLQEFSQSLALDMTKNQVTSIEYKIKGELKIRKAQHFSQFQEEWQDQYFNDSYGEKEYKTLIRNSMLIVQSGSNYSFSHTSIQEFYVAKYIYDFIERIKLDQEIMALQKHHNQDYIEKMEYSLYNQPSFNITLEHFSGSLNILKSEVISIDQLKSKLLSLVKLSGIFPKLERASSNCIYLLSFLQLNLNNQDISNINISDTKLYGLSFYNCNMQNTKMNNVAIDSCNFNKANLSNVEWKNIICKEKPFFQGHKDYIKSITITSDGSTLISGGEDNLIILWNAKTCQQIQILEGHTDMVRYVSISNDNQILASGSNDKTIRLWSIKTGKQMDVLEGHEESVTCVIFSQDSNILVSGGNDNTVRIWNIKSKQILAVLEGHQKTITSLLLYENSQKLISSGQDSKIIMWDVAKRCQSEVLQNESEVFSISLHKDEQLLSSGYKDGRIVMWDIKGLRQLSILEGHGSNVNSLSFTRSGQILASGSDDQSVRLWDVKTFKQIGYLQGHSHFVTSLVFSPDGMVLYSGSQDKMIRQWNVTATKQDYVLDGHLNYVSSLSFSPDGQMLASGSRDCSVQLWNVQEGTLLCRLEGHTEMVWCVKFSPTKMILASGGDDQTIRIWDPQFQKQLHVIKSQCDSIQSLAFSNDGSMLASGSGGFSYVIKIWNLKDYSLTQVFDVHSHTVNCLLFMKNGNIISGGADNMIFVLNVETGQKELSIKIHRGSVNSLKLVEDVLISGSSDHTIKTYNLKEQRESSVISGHQNTITSLALSHDCQMLISGSDDLSIGIWDLTTQKQVASLSAPDQVKCVDVCPVGQVFAAGCFDGSIHLFKMIDNQKFDCYKIISRCPLIQAKDCVLKNSNIVSRSDSLQPLLIQKGAIKI
ncbi:unnamed protein product [Paramecium octaurelia]|uniref:NACHT domain-containing protein n=1 Tax=Paramecium octaurelia TaxID=43137 RepID=A0A8S1XGS8_PAROT|nr:unnamed protein product [Paramecium octaurelia]